MFIGLQAWQADDKAPAYMKGEVGGQYVGSFPASTVHILT